MQRRRRLYLPIWVKILIALAVGLVVLALPAGLLLSAGTNELGIEAGRLFVTEVGSGRADAISTAINDARTTLTNFANEPTNQRLFQALLVGPGVEREASNLPDAVPADASRLFRTTLLNPATSVYDYVRLVDRSGEVVAQSSLIAGGVLAGSVANDPTFLSALNAQIQGQSQVLVITPQDDAENPTLELAEVVQWRDGNAIGFLIARLNYDRIIANNLVIPDQIRAETLDLPALIFLVSNRGAVLSLATEREPALAARGTLPVLRGLSGQRGVEVFRASPTAPEVIAFYAPIGGASLGIVAQTETGSALRLIQTFFAPRAFVVLIGFILLISVLTVLFTQLIVPSINRLRGVAQALASGDFNAPVIDAERGDEIGTLALSFVSMREGVRSLLAEQEARIAERARDFAATQEIGRFATTQRDLQKLMDTVVQLIIERFPNIYHAQIFLSDSDNTYAVLRASTGDAGRELLARGHRLGVGSASVIGQATGQGRPIIARDTTASPVHRRNELLPDTRAELAIPLRVGSATIGALDVQSRLGNAFTEGQIGVLQAMADQVAIAIENARLYEESVRRAAEIDAANRRATQRAWTEFMRDQRAVVMQREVGAQTGSDFAELRQMAQQQGRVIVGRPTERGTVPVAVPIVLRGQTLGAVEWELPAQGFGEDKIELAEELAARLAVSLDNARLFQESQRAVERERLVNQIAGRLAAQTNIDDLLKTAVREVGQAMRAPVVGIRLSGDQSKES